MLKKLLLGDQSIAQAALDSGLSGVYAYPGTPSTEITEYIQDHAPSGVHSRWCVNEKTAMEAALGASYVGCRALVCMKHVGMNVAADAFVNSAMTGANGGLVVVAADDPSMHSSQNEQDSRFYGNFSFVPIFEPSSQQEAYQMTRDAFDFSEKYRIPVLLRITTRLAHSRAVVQTTAPREANKIKMPDTSSWILMPANARRRYIQLLEDYKNFESESEQSPYNTYTAANDTSLGIVACGLAYNYLMENFPDGVPYPVVKVSQYPLPSEMLRRLAGQCREILVMEEGQPLVEQQLSTIFESSTVIHGRLDGTLPRVGELNADNVKHALRLPTNETAAISDLVMARPPALCKGCGHRDVYDALNAVLHATFPDARVFSDIGCYTLGSLPPYRAIHTCVDMGASITMAKGAADMGFYPAVAVIGDSTFTHSGMTGLLDAVNANANITIIISDNLTTAMTGGQDSAGTNRIEEICHGIGVNSAHICTFVPIAKNMAQMRAVIQQEIEYCGVSVIIPRRECIQTIKRRLKKIIPK